MSGSVTIIGGVQSNTLTGLVTVPTTGVSSGDQSALQGLLNSISTIAEAGAIGITDVNSITGSTAGTVLGGNANVLEITNTDSTGLVHSGSVTGSVAVSSSYSAVVVQVPGDLTVNGSGANQQTTYLLGGASNVVLNTNGASNATTTQIIAAGGNDTLNLSGSNSATVTGGMDRVRTLAGTNTVVASGSATVTAGTPTNYAGTLDFINNSSASAVVLGGAGSVTAFGGNAGGSFTGGTSGNNSLVGGNGSVFLVGGGSGDTLEAGANGATTSSGPNYLFAGAGNETLIATSVTGNNLLQAGGGSDAITASGSGAQYFFGAGGSATMTGSTVSGATNVYFFSNSSLTGGSDIITNFGKNSQVIALNGTKISSIASLAQSQAAPQGGSLVSLSDGTKVSLLGVNSSTLQGFVGGSAIT